MDPFEHFNATEADCVRRFLAAVREALGDGLVELWLFGSFARGDVWRATLPMHSDIDVLIVSASDVEPRLRQSLIDATYPLYLECGRQLSPQFWSRATF